MHRWLQWIAFGELAICWIAWSLAFKQPRREAAGQAKIVRAPASRWGIFLNFIGFACVFAYMRPVGLEKTIPELLASMLIGPPAVILVWKATSHLGRHWRYEAALSADHQLVQTGAYRWMRHPIYASMLGMLLSTGLAYTWWPFLVAGFLIFLIGIEIRVRAEDRLLAERFQDEFFEYKARTPAYIPFLR
ncbi:MAG TPA: isoprenylcysteine carboxylmethyltransferase family protein [Terracidiphilus sp.]|nr:isoprenylcysteine carboxylmethyltransferase family protein [Terracidiphilus sp.]